LDGAGEAVERVDGEIDGRACGTLLNIKGILGKSDREIWLRRRRWRGRLYGG
jgi:hypothetical protein